MFSYNFVAGNPETALIDQHSVVITQEAARRYFGEEDPMGKILRWNDTADLEVNGVIEKVPYNSHIQFDFMASLQLYNSERLSSCAVTFAAALITISYQVIRTALADPIDAIRFE